ncbi:MAG TPA: AmmeMemoRadiSam system protein B [Anaeromyxobacteraceae bacterium]|nr:AmmeMemoRadiSam system protein B [Anaeromyxobacteraceae bacterium]
MPPRDRPRLVPLEPKPIELEDGTQAVALRDPYGVLDGAAVVGPAVYWVLAHFDGERDLRGVTRALAEAGLEGVTLEIVEQVARQAREAGLLHGPAHEARRAEALRAFRAGPRQPVCAGGAYPDDADGLAAQLEGCYRAPGGPGVRRAGSRAGAGARRLVAPHIDIPRGAAGYAHAYAALEGCDADLFVVFGTAHASPPHLFTLTRQDYATPLGAVATDRALVDALAHELGEDELLGDELVHKGEHSCEFQVVWLRWLVGDRPFQVLPVLCSSISQLDDPAAATAPFLEALGRATAGRRVCHVAGADLAHVGPMYGDDRPATPAELAALAEQDRATMAALASADADAFHRLATADDERRRLCGVAPIYAAVRASGRTARLLHYDQWTDGVDMVSFAAAVG